MSRPAKGSDASGAEPGRPWQSLRRYDCDGRTGEVTAERDGQFCYFDDVKALLGRLSCPPPAGPPSPLPAAEIGPQAGSQGPPWGGPCVTDDSAALATERGRMAEALEAERQKAAELAAEVERLADKLAAAAAHFAGVESPYPYQGRCREMVLAGAVARTLLSRLGFAEKE